MQLSNGNLSQRYPSLSKRTWTWDALLTLVPVTELVDIPESGLNNSISCRRKAGGVGDIQRLRPLRCPLKSSEIRLPALLLLA
jgi:hypothetical protein